MTANVYSWLFQFIKPFSKSSLLLYFSSLSCKYGDQVVTGDAHPSFFSSIVALSWSLARWLEVQASQKSQHTSASNTLVQAMQHTSASITKVWTTLLQAAQNVETLHCKGRTIRTDTIASITKVCNSLVQATHYCREYTSTSNKLLQLEQTCETHFWKEHTFERSAHLKGTC